MNRKIFLKSAGALSLFSSLTSLGFSKDESEDDKKKLKKIKTIKPERLKLGDTVGLVTPGSNITSRELDECIKNVEALGFKALPSKNVLEKNGYLGGTDVQRASDVNDMFANNDVKALLCTRGGYGCARILPLLDYNLIKHNPKIVCGYSDITALIYGLYAEVGLVGFHGPVATSTFNDFSVKNFRSVLVEPTANYKMINAPSEKESDNYRIKILRGGKAEGALTGGNLSIVTSLVGTPFDIDTKGKILFLEEVGEEAYRIDRMFTQLIQAGKFDGLKGLVLGVFTKTESKNELSSSNFTLFEVLQDKLKGYGFPVVYGMSFGHIVNKFTLPIGINCMFDADEPSLTLLEPAVN